MTATANSSVIAFVRIKGCKPQRFSFQPSGPQGRAAKWLMKHFPVEEPMSDTVGRLKDKDGTIALMGCTLGDLGLLPPTPASAAPAPARQPDQTPVPRQPSLAFNELTLPPLASKSALRKLPSTSLKTLCAQRRIAVVGPTTKARMIALLVASR